MTNKIADITNEMLSAAKKIVPHAAITFEEMRDAVEALMEKQNITKEINIQDPIILAQSLIKFGPSHDGSVEHDLIAAIEKQKRCIEEIAVSLRVVLNMIEGGYQETEILKKSRATLARWELEK